MVGPEHEAKDSFDTSRLFLSAAALEVPMITVFKKGLWFRAMAMAGGSLHASFLTLSLAKWRVWCDGT